MYQNYNSSNSQLNKVMSEEQFNQVVEAIISGKYSWACLLILRFAGYNPLHYIPYRTYNRLMKVNQEQKQQLQAKVSPFSQRRNNQVSSSKSKSRDGLRDLCFVEDIEDRGQEVNGGSRVLSPLVRSSELLCS